MALSASTSRVLTLAGAALTWVASTVGCSSPSSGAPAPPTDAGALAVTLGIFTVEGQPMKVVEEGDPVDLWNATQGGHVLLVGGRVTGLSGSIATLSGRLRDPMTDEVVAEETRTVALQPASDGSDALEPNLTLRSQFSNIAVCPDGTGRGMLAPYVLELVVTDTADGRTASARRTVTPSCEAVPSSDQALCACECAPGYQLGKCAPGQ